MNIYKYDSNVPRETLHKNLYIFFMINIFKTMYINKKIIFCV